jgi:small-conductance mechanosensitive channel
MDMIADWMANNHGFDIAIAIITTALFYLIGVLFMEKIVKQAVKTHGRNWHRKDIEKRQKTLAGLFTTMWRVLVISTGALIVFGMLFPGVSLAPLFASAGVVGVALGFGAQSLVKDFLSGIFIISENQYRVGDIIDIEGFGGTVERIGARSTVLRDADGQVHYFPNGMVQHVINKTMGYSMARFFIGVHPSSDLDDIIAIINKAGEKLAKEEKWKSKIIEAPAFVSVGEFTSTSVSLLVAGKTQPSDQWSVTAEMRRRLLNEFEKKKIELSTSFPAFAPPSKK